MNPENKKTTPNGSKELTRKQKLTRRLLPAVALSLAVGGYGGTKLHDNAQYHEVGTEQTTIDQGETPVEVVSDALDTLAEEHGFGTNEVRGAVSEAQEVGAEIKDSTGEKYIQHGAAIDVTVLKNGFGNYKVEADPAAHED